MMSSKIKVLNKPIKIISYKIGFNCIKHVFLGLCRPTGVYRLRCDSQEICSGFHNKMGFCLDSIGLKNARNLFQILRIVRFFLVKQRNIFVTSYKKKEH